MAEFICVLILCFSFVVAAIGATNLILTPIASLYLKPEFEYLSGNPQFYKYPEAFFGTGIKICNFVYGTYDWFYKYPKYSTIGFIATSILITHFR